MMIQEADEVIHSSMLPLHSETLPAPPIGVHLLAYVGLHLLVRIRKDERCTLVGCSAKFTNRHAAFRRHRLNAKTKILGELRMSTHGALSRAARSMYSCDADWGMPSPIVSVCAFQFDGPDCPSRICIARLGTASPVQLHAVLRWTTPERTTPSIGLWASLHYITRSPRLPSSPHQFSLHSSHLFFLLYSQIFNPLLYILFFFSHGSLISPHCSLR